MVAAARDKANDVEMEEKELSMDGDVAGEDRQKKA
jgi:hypothetical protein